MKKFSLILLFILTYSALLASQKKVLVEVFTNSHCPLCPPAHSAVKDYMLNGSNRDNVTYIFYHMVFPYPDDPLNQVNPDDPAARNSYYGPFSSTPRGIFDGQIQSTNYSGWGSIIDSKTAEASPFEISLKSSGISNENLGLIASVKQTAAISPGNIIIYFVAVENVNYQGRNGVSDNFNVMRKMFPGPNGKSFSISLNQTIDISENISINNNWNRDELGFVVFIQDQSSKTVYQSIYMSFNSLLTDIQETKNTLPSSFILYQNYPNPFNPTTTITYSLPSIGARPVASVQLKVYDILGSEVATLVNEEKSPGHYEATFNGTFLPSGIYFYKLTVEHLIETKKMLLVK